MRRVAKVLEGFGVRLQYSVFECPLDEMRLAQAKAALEPVMIIALGFIVGFIVIAMFLPLLAVINGIGGQDAQ